jgi:hypothetical protein
MDREAYEEDFRRYQAAGRSFHEWASGARALALLRGALSSGVFDAARTPSTVEEISAATGVDEARVADLCRALEAHGVFDARVRATCSPSGSECSPPLMPRNRSRTCWPRSGRSKRPPRREALTLPSPRKMCWIWPSAPGCAHRRRRRGPSGARRLPGRCRNCTASGKGELGT